MGLLRGAAALLPSGGPLILYGPYRRAEVATAPSNRPDTFISRKGVTLSLLKADVEFPPGTVIMEDPPTHTMHRGLMSRIFTPRRMAALEDQGVIGRVPDAAARAGRDHAAAVVTAALRGRLQ